MGRDYTPTRSNAFPVHIFPDRLQRIIRELHDSNGFPADYTAASMMAAISVAIGNSHRVEVKRNWHESAILYIAIVGRPGACLSACRLRSKNSHPLAFAMQPLVNADWKNNLDYQKKYCEYQQAIAMSRKERVHAGFEQFPKEPKRLRYLVSDVTQEGLSAIHSHNPRGLCLCVDELSAWFKNFTRYNNGSEEQFWLSAFNGSTTMSDRKNSQNSIFIKRPFISVVGTIQKRLLTELANGERTANGFIDRILFAMSESTGKPKWREEEVSEDLDKAWASILDAILSVECRLDDDGEPIPVILRFTSAAKQKLYEWQHRNAEMCDNEMNDTVVSFFCKLEIYVIRFSLLLRMARWACEVEQSLPAEIGDDDVTGAIELAEKAFTFSPMELSRIHGFLFKGVLPHAGQFRTYNITKNQWILDGVTIRYGSADPLSELLNYDFGEERKFDYSTVSSANAIKHIVQFISGIWQIHAFGEGNTRTTAVFLIKYLRSFGFEVNNESFEKHSWFFRNALVRSQYENIPKGIHRTFEPLERFMNFAVFGIPADLRNRTLHIRWDEATPQSEASKHQNDVLETSLSTQLSLKEMAVIRQIQDNPNLSITAIAANTRLSKSTIDRIIRALKEKGLLTRTGAKNNAKWIINYGSES